MDCVSISDELSTHKVVIIEIVSEVVLNDEILQDVSVVDNDVNAVAVEDIFLSCG